MADRETLIAEVARAVALFQSATDLVDEAAAQCLGINRTDLRCLGLLHAHGPMNAGRLGAAAGLSPAATTAAIDRLERAGHTRRVRSAEDRRGVLVELTHEASARLEEIYGPVGCTGMELLARYSDAELHLLHTFLADGYHLQVDQAARIRAADAVAGGSPRS